MDKYFKSRIDEEKIAWLTFDTPAASTNVLSKSAINEFEQQLIHIAQMHPVGLVIESSKPKGFIAGADVKEFTNIQSAEYAEEYIRRVHDIFHRLQSLSFPTVAMIHGFCLGGGLELSLACEYRVACTSPDTRMGFPEVKLGIFPGFGGTVRSLKLVGHLRAMELMLSGRTLNAKSAKRIGLVELAVPQRQLENAARHLILTQPHKHRPPLWQQVTSLGIIRQLLAPVMRKNVAKRAPPEHYPAPYRLIDHWVNHGGYSRDLYDSEAREVSRLLMSDTAQNLIRVFQLQTRLKGMADKQHFTPQHVHVVGGGVMGGDIAAWCALKGMTVTLQDRAPKYLGNAIKRAHSLFEKKLRDPYLVQNAKDALIADHRGNGVARADVVIEAIFEDIDAKRALYGTLEPRMKPDALLATNTSSIPIETLSEKLGTPERLIGLHFFNPVAKMPLLEIVHHAETQPQTLRQALAFAGHIGKLPLPVKSSPGFLVNRVLMPYLLEAVRLQEEGVPIVEIDRAAVAFGMPMGPIELADTVGLDICLSVANKMSVALESPVPETLKVLVDQKRLGRKSDQGYYKWKNGKVIRPKRDKHFKPPSDLADRMILRLVNECVACLREGVVEEMDLIDAGIIFGTGFAPFRGGPMHYITSTGSVRLKERLGKLEALHGAQFQPDSGWALVG
ncbi:MAG: 3-hydroxyacyl-CoA dehydrogenase NAD-binding domain-containing protein [bacterium]